MTTLLDAIVAKEPQNFRFLHRPDYGCKWLVARVLSEAEAADDESPAVTYLYYWSHDDKLYVRDYDDEDHRRLPGSLTFQEPEWWNDEYDDDDGREHRQITKFVHRDKLPTPPNALFLTHEKYLQKRKPGKRDSLSTYGKSTTFIVSAACTVALFYVSVYDRQPEDALTALAFALCMAALLTSFCHAAIMRHFEKHATAKIEQEQSKTKSLEMRLAAANSLIATTQTDEQLQKELRKTKTILQSQKSETELLQQRMQAQNSQIELLQQQLQAKRAEKGLVDQKLQDSAAVIGHLESMVQEMSPENKLLRYRLHKKATEPLTAEKDISKKCCVCWENNIQSYNFPCGHCTSCDDCLDSGKLGRNCPLCRTEIQELFPVYL